MTECIELHNAKETEQLGETIANKFAKTPVLIFLRGDLGAGKTTFVQGFIRSLIKDVTVTSPTYAYLQIYRYVIPVYHFDLYRIENPEDIVELGLLEFIENKDALRLIEWPERLGIHCQTPDLDITLSKNGTRRQALIRSLQPS